MEENATPQTDEIIKDPEENENPLEKRVKEMEKGVNKLLGENKTLKSKADEADLLRGVIQESKKVAQDPQYLIDLYYSDPKIAQGILDQYYDGMTFETYLSESGLTDETPAKLTAKAKKDAEEYIVKEKINDRIELFFEKMEYSDETKTKFKEELDEINQSKLSLETLPKYLEKIHRAIASDNDDTREAKKQEQQAKRMAMGEGMSIAKNNDSKEKVFIKSMFDKLNKMGY